MVATESCLSVADSEFVVAGFGLCMEVLEASSDVKLDGNSGLLVCSVTWGVDTNVDVDVDADVGSVVSTDNGLNGVATNEITDISDAVILCGKVI